MAVPLAVTGAIFTLWIAGSSINLYSQIGMILLIGLVTKEFHSAGGVHQPAPGPGMETVAALLESGRIRPILMTSVATIMGAVPIALGLGAGSMSRRPLGYAIVGGVLFSTALTLFLVPVVYSLMEGARVRVGAAARERPVSRPVHAE